MSINKIFISYSHKDSKWLAHLTTALKPLVRNFELEVWEDTKIQAGLDWRNEIEIALNSAQIAILLVSQHFLASDFIYNVELSSVLKSAEEKGLKIIWIPISYSLFTETELNRFQAICNPNKPLDSLNINQRNKAFVDISLKLKKILDESNQVTPPFSSTLDDVAINSNNQIKPSYKNLIPSANAKKHDIITKIVICDCFNDNITFFAKHLLKELALSVNQFSFFEPSRIEAYINLLEQNPNIADMVENYFGDMSKSNSLKELGFWNQIRQFDIVIIPCNISNIIKEEFFSLTHIVKKITSKILIVKYSSKEGDQPSQNLWENRINDLGVNSISFNSSNPLSIITHIVESNPKLISDSKIDMISRSLSNLINH